MFRTNPLNYCVFGLKSRLCRSSVEPNYNWVRQKHVIWIGPYSANINFQISCKKTWMVFDNKENDVIKQAAPYQNCCDLCSLKIKFTCPSHYVTFEILLYYTCLVPVRRLFRPSRSMQFGDVSETNGRETPRQSRSAHAWAFLKSSHGQLK